LTTHSASSQSQLARYYNSFTQHFLITTTTTTTTTTANVHYYNYNARFCHQ